MTRIARIAGVAGALAVLLGACSDKGETDIVKVGRIAFEAYFPDEPVARTELTRAQIEQIPSAVLALSFEENPRVFIVPLARNGDYLTYMDSQRRGFVMHDGAVTGTLGIGFDLDAVKAAGNDPVFNQTPLADWPGQVDRSYQYQVRDGAGYVISLTCTYQKVARERIEIIEQFYDVVRIAETCTNRARQVTNLYWVDDETGFIWRSVQWVSPKQPQLTIEVVRPFLDG